jgi:hypothetical protein
VKVTWTADGAVQAFEPAGGQDDAAFDAIVSAVSKQLPPTP